MVPSSNPTLRTFMRRTIVRSIRCGIYCAVAFSLMAANVAIAQDFPNRPIRIIVPFVAGGPTDVAARLIARSMLPHLGQPVVVDNRGGAGGITGAQTVVTSAPDGYTLLLGTFGPLIVSPAVNKALSYDAIRDLAPIGQVYRSAQVLAVNPKLGVKTLAAFVAYARANPGKVNIGSAGIGTLPHLSIEILKREAGLDVTHVPYRGTSAALTEVIGGQIEALIGDVAVVAPSAQSGQVVALAVTSPERAKLLPDVQSVREAGYAALVAESWGGLLAPAGVPPQILRRLEEALQKALVDPAFQANAEKQGWGEMTTSRAAFAKFIDDETARWKPILTSSDIKLD